MIEVPQTRLGRYTILRPLGVGGMAVVYLCERQGAGGFKKQLVAKLIRTDVPQEDEQVLMFLDEARLSATLAHPHVVQVFEVDWVGHTPYIIMEYVHGPSLLRLARRAETADTPHYGHLAFAMAATCRGLHHAHFRDGPGGADVAPRLIHRDVSLQNILVSSDGVPKLIDFGIALAEDRLQHTQDGIKGKLPYLAPERIRGQPIDHRADLYAAGVCLYRATVGQFPFGGASAAETMHHILGSPLVRPSAVVPGYPPELERIVCRALEREPADRFATCAELAGELERFCASGQWASDRQELAAWIARLFPLGSEEWLSRPPAEVNLSISLLSQTSPVRMLPATRSWVGPVALGLMLGGALGLGTLAWLLPAPSEAPAAEHAAPAETVLWELPAESEQPAPEPPEPPPAPMGTLRVEGDGQVVLIGPDGRRALPGKVRAGTWTWTNEFGGGTLELAPGGTAVVRCSSFAQHCRVFTR
jgi:serine/threonine protein kinase